MTYIKETADQLQGRLARAGTPHPLPMYLPRWQSSPPPTSNRDWVDDLLARASRHNVQGVYRQPTEQGEVRVVLISYFTEASKDARALVTVDCPGMALLVWSHGPVHDYDGAVAWVKANYGPAPAPQPGQRREVK